ncbi:hypothetical protein GCM10025776_09850 [Corallincola platygyrae]|uniref:hypothetical protein n=1 Tax=Corallincola platygyrae TaxID=1193278 RepID=UPI0031E9C592
MDIDRSEKTRSTLGYMFVACFGVGLGLYLLTFILVQYGHHPESYGYFDLFKLSLGLSLITSLASFLIAMVLLVPFYKLTSHYRFVSYSSMAFCGALPGFAFYLYESNRFYLCCIFIGMLIALSFTKLKATRTSKRNYGRKYEE